MTGGSRDRASPKKAFPETGELAEIRPVEVLRFCAAVRFCGSLAFQARDLRGVIPVLGGSPEIRADDPTIAAALEQFQARRHGRFTLQGFLPPYAGALTDGALGVFGDLAMTSVGEIFRYGEVIGLTGKIKFQHPSGAFAEVHVVMGRVKTLLVEAADTEAFDAFFAWNQGSYQIEQVSYFKPEPGPPPTGIVLVQGLTLPLADVLLRCAAGASRPGRTRPRDIPAPPSIRTSGMAEFGVWETQSGRPVPPSAAAASLKSLGSPPPPALDAEVRVQLVQRRFSERPTLRPEGTAEAVAPPTIPPGVLEFLDGDVVESTRGKSRQWQAGPTLAPGAPAEEEAAPKSRTESGGYLRPPRAPADLRPMHETPLQQPAFRGAQETPLEQPAFRGPQTTPAAPPQPRGSPVAPRAVTPAGGPRTRTPGFRPQQDTWRDPFGDEEITSPGDAAATAPGAPRTRSGPRDSTPDDPAAKRAARMR